MTYFVIQEPSEKPRKVQLCSRGQTLQTSRGHEASMLELARLKLRQSELLEASGFSRLPLTDGTEILSCEVA